MSSLTFQEFSQINRQRSESPYGFEHPLSNWSPADWMTATVGELGEAANVIKKMKRAQDGIKGNKEDMATLQNKLQRELADTVTYLDLMCQSMGMDLGTILIQKFNEKSEEIGYPNRIIYKR